MKPKRKVKAWFLLLNGHELADMSYWPAEDLSTSEDDWVETRLLPAVRPLLKLRQKTLREMPITFWVCTRDTARLDRDEIFVAVTPFEMRQKLRDWVAAALLTIPDPDARVFAGVEPVPDGWMPVCQVFRGKLLRFYADESEHGLVKPEIRWGAGMPRPVISTFDPGPAANPEMCDELWVRAEVDDVMPALHYREWHQALRTIAMIDDGRRRP
jgi:hypothetical protein